MKTMLIALLTILITSSVGAIQNENIVKNGSFEEDTNGDGMADEWQFAGDSGVTVTWKRDEGFTGGFSQKINCTQFTSLSPASHVMLCQMDRVRLEKGKWYKISFAARQENIPGRAVHVAISNMKQWRNCGLQESFRIHGKWQEFDFVFMATETISEQVRLQFWYTSTGSFWLDNVRIEPSKPIVKRFREAAPAAKGINVLANSSFECGASGWASIADLPGWGGNLNLPVGTVDTTTGKFHESSFKIALNPKTIPIFYFDYFPLYRVPVKAPLLGNRGWIAVEPGADYTLSAYMKADVEDLVGVLSIRQALGRNLRKEVKLTTKWQRYAFSFQPQGDQVFAALGPDLEASKKEEGTVWIDGVQLEKSSQATPYRPGTSVEAGLETERLGNLFSYGNEPKMTATVFNAEQVTRTIKLQARITNFDEAIVYEVMLPVDIGPEQNVSVTIPCGVRQKGFYRLHLSAEGAVVIPRQPIRFAIIEPYTKSDSLFGMNHAYPWSHLLDLSKQIGLCWFRDWSLKWHDVEPEQGKFEFTQADYQINRVLERGLKVLGLLPFPSSNWSSSAGAEVKATEPYAPNGGRITYMPRDMNEFAAYVHKTVRHYRDRLQVWEILNEPIYTSYALPRGRGYLVEDYVKLLRAAYSAVKQADPDSLVIGGIAGSAATYTKEFIDAGGLRWVDILNLHSYPGLTEPEAYEESLRQLRERMRSAGGDKPIWFTEGAYYADDDMPYEPYDSTWLKPVDSEAEAAEWQVKLNTLLLCYGAEKIIYHSGTPGSLNDESLSGIFFEWAGAPRKMLVTQSAMSNLLLPPIKSIGALKGPKMIKAYGFETDGQTVIVAWAKESAEPQTISLTGKDWRAVDLQGNELKVENIILTERPIYFVAKKTGIQEFPW